MISFWEQESLLKYDTIIIGGGIIGLCTAIHYLQKHKDKSLLLLERGVLPSGASTKNAGFACFGSATEILHDIRLNGLETTVAIVEKRIMGLQKLRKLVGDSSIDYENSGGYELLFQEQTISKQEIDFVNNALFKFFQDHIFKTRNNLIYTFGFDTVHSIIENIHEGQINSGKLIKKLMQKAQSLGTTILCGSEVAEVEESSNNVVVKVWNKAIDQELNFSASQLVYCSNAFANKFAPSLDLKPARGQVLITKPIDNLKFKGAFHFDEGYYYFRNVGSRVLLGGGRNMDFAKEESFSFEQNDNIINKLKSILQSVILPKTDFEIDMVWQGIMGFSKNKLPTIKRLTSKQLCGFACNGMGVALGCLVAEELADMIE